MAANTSKNLVHEFLLEEYKELNHTLHINEERGESRMQFFVTLSSVVLGAIGLLIKEFKDIDPKFLTLIYLIIILFLAGLLCIGIITQKRLKKRNAITDGLKKDIKEIRRIFKEDIDPSHEILPVDYSAFASRNKPGDAKEGRNYTSLFHIASVINCVLAGTAVAFIGFAVGLSDNMIIVLSLLTSACLGVIIMLDNKAANSSD